MILLVNTKKKKKTENLAVTLTSKLLQIKEHLNQKIKQKTSRPEFDFS